MTDRKMSKNTFWGLINQKEIVIPKLQRDYVQGQSVNDSIRKDFLQSIKSALDNPDSNYMVLDFIYGMSDGNKFIPIDGQQRLTALWILHWYLAYRCDKLKNSKELLSKFHYQTRSSSNRVFKKLLDIDTPQDQSVGIVKHIIDQSWFHNEYLHDPTVTSLLAVLGDEDNSIESLFRGKKEEELKGYLEMLTDSGKCPIFFFLLDIDDNGLSDDIYIKMNARGEMLDNLEKIKVDLLHIIKGTDLYDKVAIAFDNEWLLPFCPENKDDWDTVDFDELFYVFILRFYFSYYALKHNNNTALCEALYQRITNDDNIKKYHSLLQFKVSSADLGESYEFDNQFVADFNSFMKKFLKFFKDYKNNTGIPTTWYLRKTKELHFLPAFSQKEIEVERLSQIQMIVFSMIVKFFMDSQDNSSIDEEYIKLKRWLRVVWNIVSIVDKNGENVIRSIGSMVSAINVLKAFDSHDIYGSLSNYCCNNMIDSSAVQRHILEEKIKAEIIQSDPAKWEENLIRAEGMNNLEGDISFLYHDGEGKVAWDCFEKKSNSYYKYFNGDQANSLSRFSAFICCFSEDKLKELCDCDIFLWEDKDLLSWRCMLNNPNMRHAVHHFLSLDGELIPDELHKRIISAFIIKMEHVGKELYKDQVFLKYDDRYGFFVYRYYGHTSKCLSIYGGPIDNAICWNLEEYLENKHYSAENIKLFADYRCANIDKGPNRKFILSGDSLKHCDDNWEICETWYNSQSVNWLEECKNRLTAE